MDLDDLLETYSSNLFDAEEVIPLLSIWFS